MSSSIEGIPPGVDESFIKKWLEPRVSPKRLKHIKGVVKVAHKLAERHDCDTYLARLGGWLHDACKEWKADVLVAKAKELGVSYGPIEEAQGHLLHGPVAAAVARTELGISNQDLLNAVAEHTLGNVPMSRLSEVLYLADCLDDTRPTDYTAPIWAALSFDDEFNINKAIVTAADLGLLHLMETARPIHPLTVAVRNYYLERLKSEQ